MNKSLHISTTFDQPGLLENLVEKLACRRSDIGYGKEKMPLDFEALETSSTETYVSGTVSLSDKDESINMPFTSSFLFTCIKGKDDHYKLTWAISLS
ncbi:MAG: hypothetical protein Q8941_20310 [Bacteroidota bacterium]|nr:hypothetical protein [Bacteroidota bacterium]